LNPLSRLIRCLLGLFLAVSLSQAWSAPGVAGLVSGLTNPAASETPTSTNPSTEVVLETLRKKLADATKDLAEAAAREISGEVATAGEIAEDSLLRQQMIRVYQRQIDTLLNLQNLRQRKVQLEKETHDWTDFKSLPPYSFLLVDELREKVRSLKDRIAALTQMDAFISEEGQRRKETLKEIAEKLRQANERLENKTDISPRSIWLRDLEVMRNRLAEARVETLDGERQINDQELIEARQRLDFAERQLTVAKPHMSFPHPDQEQVRARLTADNQRIQAELESSIPILDDDRKAYNEAIANLEKAGADSNQNPDHASLADLENQAEILRVKAENGDLKLQSLNRILDALKMRSKAWELRWAQAESEDVQAYARIDKAKETVRPVKAYVSQHLFLTRGQIADMEKQSYDLAPDEIEQHEKLHGLYLEREANYKRVLAYLETNLQLLGLWKQDLDDRHQTEPWSDRLQEWLAEGTEILVNVWEFELFAVEDSIVVEGQTITGKRSVTLGKVLTALLILVVGLWLSAKITFYAERIVVNRFGMEASAARIARRWLLFLVGVILLMTSMVMVKIPLTAFAFTGGALAIGAGFGMQNLLKNLISGLMLLMERPFKPGDLVEVSGIRGRVIDIGMRSSHIRDGNGIETLIPNSTFIEENVTNWTLSSQAVRITVKIGVAYGSPVQELTELLLATADRHGLVLDKPAPEVVFEDFAADALQFGLFAWVELKPGVDWRVIASDLRYMIYKTFAAHGIVMAFPQRDIHIDASQPLPVRLYKEPTG